MFIHILRGNQFWCLIIYFVQIAKATQNQKKCSFTSNWKFNALKRSKQKFFIWKLRFCLIIYLEEEKRANKLGTKKTWNWNKWNWANKNDFQRTWSNFSEETWFKEKKIKKIESVLTVFGESKILKFIDEEVQLDLWI